jgi:signal peptidase
MQPYVGAVHESHRWAGRSYAFPRWLWSLERALGLVLIAVVSLVAVASVLVLTLHLSVRPVLTGSMQPTFGAGSLVVTRSVPTESLQPGDVIAFTPPGQSNIYVHRIVSITGSRAQPIIATRGDANAADDPWHARIVSKTTPVALFAIPWLGNLVQMLHNPLDRSVLLGLLALTIAMVALQLFLERPREHRPGESDTRGTGHQSTAY